MRFYKAYHREPAGSDLGNLFTSVAFGLVTSFYKYVGVYVGLTFLFSFACRHVVLILKHNLRTHPMVFLENYFCMLHAPGAYQKMFVLFHPCMNGPKVTHSLMFSIKLPSNAHFGFLNNILMGFYTSFRETISYF